MKRAFTLIELMVVIGMIAVLMAAMGVSVSRARTRAKISKATQEAKEMTTAILAFEQYAKNHTLADYVTKWSPCTKGSMAMILGGVTGDNGEQVPVLFNAAIRGDKILDPWGNPYDYMIQEAADQGETDALGLKTALALPNFFRLTDSERK